jgi:hypothetical protein
MSMLSKSIIMVSIILFIGCETAYKINERNIRVRYVNIAIIYEYIVNNDPDALTARRQKEIIIKSIADLEKNLLQGQIEIPRDVIKSDIERNRENLQKINIMENRVKSKYLNEINNSITVLANRMGVDYVFNIGDELVFSKKEYDITDDVIKEIMKLRKRNAPPSR